MKKIFLFVWAVFLVGFGCGEAPVDPGGENPESPTFIIDFQHEIDWSKKPVGYAVSQVFNGIYFLNTPTAIGREIEFKKDTAYVVLERADSLKGRPYRVTAVVHLIGEMGEKSRSYYHRVYGDSLSALKVNKFHFKTDFSGSWE